MSDPVSFLGGRVVLRAGDCREAIKAIGDNSIDAVVTDPPYALVSIGKRFGKPGSAPAMHGRDGLYARASAGFMGKAWDTGEVAFDPAFWAEVLRVLKPGGHIAAFSATTTFDQMVGALRLAGFHIRDTILDLIDIDPSVEAFLDSLTDAQRAALMRIEDLVNPYGLLAWVYGSGFAKKGYIRRSDGEIAREGWGGQLKPAFEPIVLARKPFRGTVAEAMQEYGTAALNIDGCRVGNEGGTAGAGASVTVFGDGLNGAFGTPVPGLGRWPANILHDGSDEVLAAFSSAPGQQRPVTGEERSHRTAHAYGDFGASREGFEPRLDSGSAARFFYSAKADAEDRIGSKHPTVKPVDLMQWLCRLITPPGGTVLDPFAGTGTTGEAAFREGFSAVLIEREEDYRTDIARRMALAEAGPATRKAESAKARFGTLDAGPLFGALEEVKSDA